MAGTPSSLHRWWGFELSSILHLHGSCSYLLSNLRDPLKDFPVSYFDLHFSNKDIFILKKHLAFPVPKTVSFVEGEFADAWPWFSISLPT